MCWTSTRISHKQCTPALPVSGVTTFLAPPMWWGELSVATHSWPVSPVHCEPFVPPCLSQDTRTRFDVFSVESRIWLCFEPVNALLSCIKFPEGFFQSEKPLPNHVSVTSYSVDCFYVDSTRSRKEKKRETSPSISFSTTQLKDKAMSWTTQPTVACYISFLPCLQHSNQPQATHVSCNNIDSTFCNRNRIITFIWRRKKKSENNSFKIAQLGKGSRRAIEPR